MRGAINNISHNFYIGIPCVCEFRGVPFNVALHTMNATVANQTYQFRQRMGCLGDAFPIVFPNPYHEAHVTSATLFMNGNYYAAKREITSIMRNSTRLIHAVAGKSHNISALPFRVDKLHPVSHRGAFETNYAAMRTVEYASQFGRGDVVMIMAGPLGRILASEWTRLRPDVTFLELGSFWDEELWQRSYHHGANVPCMFRSDVSDPLVPGPP